MKLNTIHLLAGVCSTMVATQVGAALMGLSAPANSPYYADFALSGLSFSETYDPATQTATLSVTTHGTATEHYISSPQSPGSHGNPILGRKPENAFPGGFSLTALIRYENGNWILESGSFTVYGNLGRGTGHKGDILLHRRNEGAGDVLLHGNLDPGVSGPNGTFGYRTSTSDPRQFEFRYTVDTTPNVAANGKNAILEDWATANPLGTIVQGAMILDVANGDWNWAGDWSDPWTRCANGYGNVFVPESSHYGWLGAGLAALAAVFVGCRTRRSELG